MRNSEESYVFHISKFSEYYFGINKLRCIICFALYQKLDHILSENHFYNILRMINVKKNVFRKFMKNPYISCLPLSLIFNSNQYWIGIYSNQYLPQTVPVPPPTVPVPGPMPYLLINSYPGRPRFLSTYPGRPPRPQSPEIPA